jgi:hypothetical protein
MKPKALLMIVFLLTLLVSLLPTPGTASAAPGSQIAAAATASAAQPISVFEIGPVILQERVGQGETMHLVGAVKLVGGWNVSRYVGMRTYLTQPFTEGRLVKLRPSLEAGVFLRF